MIIELSRFNSLTSFSNSDWINSFQPLTIQPQGQLSFKGGFLDYNTSSEQVIELLQDVNINIETGFYVCSPVNQDGLIVGNPEKYVPLDLYIARDGQDNFKLIKSSRSFTIPAGNYSPDEITEIINFNCVNYNPPIHGDGSFFNNQANLNFFRPTTNNFNSVALELIPKDSDTGIATLIARNPSDLQYFKNGDYVTFIDIGKLTGDTTGNIDEAYNITSLNTTTGVITTNPPFRRLATYTMGNPYMYKYVYDPTDGSSDIDTTDCWRFYKQASASKPFDNTTSWLLDPNNDRITNYMGCSQFQLEYNYNNNSLFQFSYLHTPFYSGGQEAIQLYACGYRYNNIFTYMNTMTGIFFTKLEPASFWEDALGFNLNTLIVTDDDTSHILSAPLQVGVNITGNLVTYDALFDKTNPPRMYDDNESHEKAQVVNAVSTQSQAIVANKPQQVNSSSFYLIELGGLSDINMINDTDLFRTISAIGSKEYNSQGIISIYPDGTAFYTNNSPEPLYLSSFRVRILDSITKQPTTSLGGKNSIFIEMTNPPPSVKKN